MFLSEWREFSSAPCIGGGGVGGSGNLMTDCVSILLKSRASLECFRACFLTGRAKDLSAPRYCNHLSSNADVLVGKPSSVTEDAVL